MKKENLQDVLDFQMKLKELKYFKIIFFLLYNMAELTDKENIIKNIYEDKELGYGSIRDTFQQAVKKDPTIKYEDVKKYLDKLPHRQTQFKYKGFNSFVSPHPLFELEVDLIDLTKKQKKTMNLGIVWLLSKILLSLLGALQLKQNNQLM